MCRLRFAYLADHPEWISTLAGWFYAEWGGRIAGQKVKLFEERLQGRLNRDKLPLTLIAFAEDEMVASASLKIQEMGTHPRYLHWLGSVYVKQSFRRKGIGTQLVEHASQVASGLRVASLFLYTHGHEDFYARLGWHVVERAQYHGRRVAIMERVITQRTQEADSEK